MPRLRRVDCSEPGIRRVRRGRGFSYQEEDGSPISDRELIERIRELVIPPAWQEVWICPHPRGHIQATGYDAAGRKQYLYHPAWRESRDRDKFASMQSFARALPRMRERTRADLARRGLVRERVLGCSVRLLDLGFFRIGSERYAAENETFGLATLRRRHVRVGGGGGHALLAFRAGREWADVRAADINEYLKAVMEGDRTAKDFRTWNATVLAAVELAAGGAEARTKTARKRAASAATERVAAYLSNTPAVCRSAYIDPRVFDRYDAGATIGDSLRRIAADGDPGEFADRERIERAVLRLIA